MNQTNTLVRSRSLVIENTTVAFRATSLWMLIVLLLAAAPSALAGTCEQYTRRSVEFNATRSLSVQVENHRRANPVCGALMNMETWTNANIIEGAREQNNPPYEEDTVHDPNRYMMQKQITDGNSKSCALATFSLLPSGKFAIADPGVNYYATGTVAMPYLCYPMMDPPWREQDNNMCGYLGGTSCSGGPGTCGTGGAGSGGSGGCGGGGGGGGGSGSSCSAGGDSSCGGSSPGACGSTGSCSGFTCGGASKSACGGGGLTGGGACGLMPPMAGAMIDNDDFAICLGSMCSILVQEGLNPRNWVQTIRHYAQIAGATTADLQGQVAQITTRTGYEASTAYLINVANEDAAQRTSSSSTTRTYAQAIWMVQQMYKQCFIPMAILFILPGAIITQCKGLISHSFFANADSRRGDDDAASPYAGCIRAMIAVFLIPATQLTVSYMCDVGNSLTDSVRNQINMKLLVKWADAQAYSTNPRRDDNYIGQTNDVTAGEIQPERAKMHGGDADTAISEREVNTGTQMRELFNTTNALLSQLWVCMHGLQLVMMCYLFLLGPIAAALYAWPAGLGRDLFKGVFANWLDAVVVLALWKFWWCLILLVMSIRLELGGVDPNNQYELFYYTAFLALITYVPFQPFEFKPGPIVSNALDRASAALRQRPTNPTTNPGPGTAAPG